MLFCSFSNFQSRNAHIQRLNFDQLDPFSRMTPKVCYINLKNSENLSRAGALGRRFPCDPIRAKIRRLGMGDQESIRQPLKSQEDKAFFHQVKSHVFLRYRAQKAKLLNSTRCIFISSMDIRQTLSLSRVAASHLK